MGIESASEGLLKYRREQNQPRPAQRTSNAEHDLTRPKFPSGRGTKSGEVATVATCPIDLARVNRMANRR